MLNDSTSNDKSEMSPDSGTFADDDPTPPSGYPFAGQVPPPPGDAEEHARLMTQLQMEMLTDFAMSLDALKGAPLRAHVALDPDALAAWAVDLLRTQQASGFAAVVAVGAVLGFVPTEARSPLANAVAWPDAFAEMLIIAEATLTPGDYVKVRNRIAVGVIGVIMQNALKVQEAAS